MTRRIKKKRNKFIQYRSKNDKIHTFENILTFGIIKNFFEDSLDEVQLNIYSNEYKEEPHIHLDCESKHFHSCICLLKSNYYIQNSSCNTLNDRQKYILDDFMNKISNDGFRTFWESACLLWSMNEPKSKTALGYRKPNYKNLNIISTNNIN